MNPADTGDVASPCIGICMMDDTLGHCLGCGRTRAEIGRWLRFTIGQKRVVVERALARLGRLPPEAAGACES